MATNSPLPCSPSVTEIHVNDIEKMKDNSVHDSISTVKDSHHDNTTTTSYGEHDDNGVNAIDEHSDDVHKHHDVKQQQQQQQQATQNLSKTDRHSDSSDDYTLDDWPDNLHIDVSWEDDCERHGSRQRQRRKISNMHRTVYREKLQRSLSERIIEYKMKHDWSCLPTSAPNDSGLLAQPISKPLYLSDIRSSLSPTAICMTLDSSTSTLPPLRKYTLFAQVPLSCSIPSPKCTSPLYNLKNERRSQLIRQHANEIVSVDTIAELANLIEFVLKAGPYVVWIDIYYPDSYDMVFFEDTFEVHPLTSEDILTRETREKSESFDDYLFLSVHNSQNVATADELCTWNEASLNSSNLYIVMSSVAVVTFHEQPAPCVSNVLRRLWQNREPGKPDWIMYSILDDIVDCLQPMVSEADREVLITDELVLMLSGTEREDVLRRIGNTRRQLQTVYRNLVPKREMLSSLTSRGRWLLSKNTFIHLRDVMDHVLSMLAIIDASKETLNSSQANYLAKVSLEVATASHGMDAVMKKLTLAATIALPLNIIAGLFGMNVPVPGQHSENVGWFFAIVASMLILSIASLKILLRMGY